MVIAVSLQSLHPLLEDGCIEEEQPEAYKKVACVAISNWALDPAKMNRGIHVHRGVPDVNELEESAKLVFTYLTYMMFTFIFAFLTFLIVVLETENRI